MVDPPNGFDRSKNLIPRLQASARNVSTCLKQWVNEFCNPCPGCFKARAWLAFAGEVAEISPAGFCNLLKSLIVTFGMKLAV